MSSKNFTLILDLLALAAKYGIPAVKRIVETWKDDMSEEEIRVAIEDCQAKLKRPEEYFGQ